MRTLSDRVVTSGFLDAEPGEGEAARRFMRRVVADYARGQARWIDELESWDGDWRDASEMSDIALRLTPAQLKSLRDELLALMVREPARRAPAPSDGEALWAGVHRLARHRVLSPLTVTYAGIDLAMQGALPLAPDPRLHRLRA